jgi:putative glycosyltransferase (exosortase G-associated)
MLKYWLELTFFKMGFWLTWTLIPVVVDIIPAFIASVWLIFHTLHLPRPKHPAKLPLISLIIPIYNSEETLFECIWSVYRSTYPRELIQIILADNQSVDDSFGVYTRAQERFFDLNIQYLRTEKGKAKALNAAIYSSIGTYIINIDSDGILEKNALLNMVLRFENQPQIAALTGTILPQASRIKAQKDSRLKLLQVNEYFEYARAFLSGRTIESRRNRLFTMSGAFSAFRKSSLLSTFLYNTETIGEDTDITFQLRDRLKERVEICTDAIFYIEPIPSLNSLYQQRQRWQRGEVEVVEQHHQNLGLNSFFSNFLVRRMMIDHTFVFPQMIWLFASLVLVFWGYSGILLLLSYVLIYLLYVVANILNYICVLLLLKPFPAEKRFFKSLWWVAWTLPFYVFLCSWIRMIGILNSMTQHSSWNSLSLKSEKNKLHQVLTDDLKKLAEIRKQTRK